MATTVRRLQNARSKVADAMRGIDKVRAEIREKLGDHMMTSAEDQLQPGRIPTGIFSLDLALCGGIPENRVTQFNGRKSAGKSTACELTMAQAQIMASAYARDEEVVFIDQEGHRDKTWGRKLGVDNNKLNYVPSTTGEQTLDIIEALIRVPEVSLIVLDSVAALTSTHEEESSAEDNQKPGGTSKLISSFTRKVTLAMVKERANGHYPTLLITNQDRAVIGGMSKPGMPPAISHPGSKALEHLLSVDVRFSNKEETGNVTPTTGGTGGELDYNTHGFNLQKNKMNAGFTRGEYQLRRRPHPTKPQLTEGKVDDSVAMLATAKRMGFYTGGGSSWTLTFGDYEEKYKSADACIEVLDDNPDFKWELRNYLIAHHAAGLDLDPGFIAYLLTHRMPQV